MRRKPILKGAVAGVRGVKNASKLARAVLDSDHTMIIGDGAHDFAIECGNGFETEKKYRVQCNPPFQISIRSVKIEIVSEQSLVTDYEKAQLQELQRYDKAVGNIFRDQMGHDTVGAVALDDKGNFAACTSTGGVTFKRVGRVGDSPLAGAF